MNAGLMERCFNLCRTADVQGLLLCAEDSETLEMLSRRVENDAKTNESARMLYSMLVRLTPRLIGTKLLEELLTLKRELWLLRDPITHVGEQP